ncbi:MAG: hypothetical protein ACRCZ6_17810 [Kluyvera sp.]|uniref:hypothetical protein n=1 Tax=Kluyvera sp. TaxID=1538228 RepID=UPI003F2B0E9B
MIKWLSPLSNESTILKSTVFVAIMTLQVRPVSGISLPIHLQCVGSQNQPVNVNWQDYPGKLIMQNKSLQLYQEKKSKLGHMLRFYHISDSNQKLAIIESDNAIKIIYAEDGQEFVVDCL